MKTLRIMMAILILGSVFVPLTSCASKSAPASENQVAAVTRGNLTIDIVAGGNLMLSKKEDLAFEVAGTVAEVAVQVGEAVKEGQVLARLDTAPLEEALKTAERAMRNAELDLKDAEDGKFKIKTAEYDLETATNNFNKLNYPYSYSTFAIEIPAAIESVKEAQRQLEEAKAGLEAGPGSETYGEAWDRFRKAQDNLAKALERLLRGQSIDVWSSTNVSKTISDYMAARAALIAMEKAQYTLEQTKRSFQSALDKANLALDKARDDLNKARDRLAKAVILASFAGFITKVNVSGGDEVQKGTIAVQLADPAKFEAKIMVGERDIFKVTEGGTATVQVDVMPTIVLTAKVTHISPTATIQSGVVNYEVKVEAEAPKSAGLQGQSQQVSPPSGQQTGTSGSSRVATSSVSQISQLREGLSVTVNIIVAERKDVLLVPNQAITRSGREVQVQVIKNEVAEKRVVKTGLSNWQYTEVTGGLAEGEEVVIPKTVTATPSQGQQPQGGIVPGLPRMLR